MSTAKRKKKKPINQQKKLVLNPQKEIYDVDAAPHVFSKDEIADVLEVEPGVITEATIINGNDGETKVIVDVEEDDDDDIAEDDFTDFGDNQSDRVIKSFECIMKDLEGDSDLNCPDLNNLILQSIPRPDNTSTIILKAGITNVIDGRAMPVNNMPFTKFADLLKRDFDFVNSNVELGKPLTCAMPEVYRCGCMFTTFGDNIEVENTDSIYIYIYPHKLEAFISEFVIKEMVFVDCRDQLSDGYYNAFINGVNVNLPIMRGYYVSMPKLIEHIKNDAYNTFEYDGENFKTDIIHVSNYVNLDHNAWSKGTIELFTELSAMNAARSMHQL